MYAVCLATLQSEDTIDATALRNDESMLFQLLHTFAHAVLRAAYPGGLFLLPCQAATPQLVEPIVCWEVSPIFRGTISDPLFSKRT